MESAAGRLSLRAHTTLTYGPWVDSVPRIFLRSNASRLVFWVKRVLGFSLQLSLVRIWVLGLGTILGEPHSERIWNYTSRISLR